jgi:hypothetical protein
VDEHWREGLDDALRLSASMTRKCAVAGLANGGADKAGTTPADAARQLAAGRLAGAGARSPGWQTARRLQ